jgi:uncharacterized membrane protein YhiD involved in acid resistance
MGVGACSGAVVDCSELVAGADLAATVSVGFASGAGTPHRAATKSVTTLAVATMESAVEQRATIFPD